jgi:hypothetical protein
MELVCYFGNSRAEDGLVIALVSSVLHREMGD